MKKLRTTFGVPGVHDPDERIIVHTACVVEALNQIPHADLALFVEPAMSMAELGLQRWPGAQGVLRWTHESDDARRTHLFAGVVTHARTLMDGEGLVTRIELRLHAWPAAEGGCSYAQRYQFYEGRNSLELAESLFRGAGGTFERSPAAASDTRAYEVQYGESDEAFVLRILSEDHLVCTIAPDWSADGFPTQPVALRMTVLDALLDLPPPSDAAAMLEHLPHQALALGARHGVYDLTESLVRGPSEIAFAAMAPEQVNVDLRVAARSPHDAHQWVDVSANQRAENRQRLGLKAEAALAAARESLQTFESALPWARAGHRCRLNAAGAERWVALLVSRLEFSRNAVGECVLTAKTTATEVNNAWLPPQQPRPSLPSLLYGTVLDASAEPGPARQHRVPDNEVHTDGQGRIRVRIAWHTRARSDDSGDSSIWLRMMTPWAGHGAGFFALPRAGQEVVVGFISGDAAQPVVLGALYAAVREGGGTPPWPAASAEQWVGIGTRSETGHAQHLRLSGDPKHPRVELHGARDVDLRGGQDVVSHSGRNWSACADQSMSLRAGRVVDIHSEGTAQIVAVDELTLRARTVKVESVTSEHKTEKISFTTGWTKYASYMHGFDAYIRKDTAISVDSKTVGWEFKVAGMTNQLRGVQFDVNAVKSEIVGRKDEFKYSETQHVIAALKTVGIEAKTVATKSDLSGAKLKTSGNVVSAGGPRTDASAFNLFV